MAAMIYLLKDMAAASVYLFRDQICVTENRE